MSDIVGDGSVHAGKKTAFPVLQKDLAVDMARTPESPPGYPGRRRRRARHRSGLLSGLVKLICLSGEAFGRHDVPARVQIRIGDSLIFIAFGISCVRRNSADFS